MNAIMQNLSEKLEQGLEAYANSESYAQLLSVMSKFHNYSANNCLLIASQCLYPTYVAGYNKWRDDFHRQVKKGAKSIMIKAPMTYRDKETDEEKLGFKATYVFDISDTYQIPGKPEVPIGIGELQGSVNNYADIMSALISISPVPVSIKKIKGSALGLYNDTTKEIVIKEGLSELQTVKTMVHELAHSLLHSENPCIESKTEEQDRCFKEFEAESVAFVVCKYLTLDTDEYSFPYILSWSQDEIKTYLKDELPTVQKTANHIITKLCEGMKA